MRLRRLPSLPDLQQVPHAGTTIFREQRVRPSHGEWFFKFYLDSPQGSKHLRRHVVLEAFPSHILQNCADQAIAVVRIEFDIAWSVDARGQDLLHEQPHGRLLTISKTIANEAVVQA